MSKKKLLVVGGHGSGEIAMSAFEASNMIKDEWELVGFLSDVSDPGTYIGKYKIIGTSNEVNYWANKGYYIHYTLHFNAKQKEKRVQNLSKLNIPKDAFASVVHPKAYLHPGSKLGHNTLLMPFSSTSAGSELGSHSHVYTSGFLGHDSKVGDYCTIAAHSIVGGRVKIEKGAHVGLNSCIREDLVIGKYSIIGMGSVLLEDVPNFTIYAGNPAKHIKSLK